MYCLSNATCDPHPDTVFKEDAKDTGCVGPLKGSNTKLEKTPVCMDETDDKKDGYADQNGRRSPNTRSLGAVSGVSGRSKELFIKGHSRTDSGYLIIFSAVLHTLPHKAPYIPEDPRVSIEETVGSRNKIEDEKLGKEDTLSDEVTESEESDQDEDSGPSGVYVENQPKGTALRNKRDSHGIHTQEANKPFPVEYDIKSYGQNPNTIDRVQDNVVKGNCQKDCTSAEDHNESDQIDTKSYGNTVVQSFDDNKGKTENKDKGYNSLREAPSSKTEANEIHADFREALQKDFANLTNADIDVMEVCDNIYQDGMMPLDAYKEFLSRSALNYDKKSNRRHLLTFLSSESFPLERLVDAVAKAGHLHFFIDVFNRL